MSREEWGDPTERQEPPQCCPVCHNEWHAEDCELGQEVSRRLKAEAERDRLVAEVARQIEARDAVAAAEYRLIGELCAMQRDRDRYRDALIACRPAVQYAKLHAQSDMSRAVLTEHIDTIDAAAAAKGQG